MAKRSRGSTSRPGQRARLQRGIGERTPLAKPVVAPRPVTLTEEEEARAAELEATIVAAERAAESAAAGVRERSRRAPAAGETRVGTGSIAMRASLEYAYVSRDVRRIALIGGSLVAFLIGLWAVTQATGVGPA